MKYLFVDFDGVLHGEQLNRDLFCHSYMFCHKLFPYKHLFKIIVSSSWRDQYDYEVCQHAFEICIRDTVIGVTPSFGLAGFEKDGRYLEIISSCQEHGIPMHQWLAIDDMQDLFPENCPNLLLINGKIGITSEQVEQIIQWLLLK